MTVTVVGIGADGWPGLAPASAAAVAYSAIQVGVRCAEVMRVV